MNDPTTVIRPAERGDLDYILSSWMRTYEHAPEMNMPGMIRDEYFRMTHLVLDELIARASRAGSLYVACERNAPHLIKGYLCGEAFDRPPIAYLHWVQVKKQYWRQGICTALVDKYVKDFGITAEQNMLYTFSNKAMRIPGFAQHMNERYSMVYYPWFKYTSQEPGWESGIV